MSAFPGRPGGGGLASSKQACCNCNCPPPPHPHPTTTTGSRQDFVAEAGASRKSVGPWELSVGTQIEWGTRWWSRFGAVPGRLSVGPWELSVGTQIEWGTRRWTRFGAIQVPPPPPPTTWLPPVAGRRGALPPQPRSSYLSDDPLSSHSSRH
jgi:hypothetical protein